MMAPASRKPAGRGIRSRATRRYAASGPGRGLSVAREIVEQYDGEIIAGESLLGGACMEVVLAPPDDTEDEQG
jgi:signal transduction histidine kinase